jgi:acyl carrier protein
MMNDRDNLKALVFASVAATFGFPEDKLEEGMNAGDIEGWDSISTSYLLLDIEERLGRELDIEQVLEASNLGEMIDLIAAGAGAS